MSSLGQRIFLRRWRFGESWNGYLASFCTPYSVPKVRFLRESLLGQGSSSVLPALSPAEGVVATLRAHLTKATGFSDEAGVVKSVLATAAFLGGLPLAVPPRRWLVGQIFLRLSSFHHPASLVSFRRGQLPCPLL
jgi:hypothetical protein